MVYGNNFRQVWTGWIAVSTNVANRRWYPFALADLVLMKEIKSEKGQRESNFVATKKIQIASNGGKLPKPERE